MPVRAAGKARHVLAADLDALRTAVCDTGAWRMLGPHDPYLDLRDRTVLLDDVQKQRIVWQTVSNPGALLCGGRIAGVWRLTFCTVMPESFEVCLRQGNESCSMRKLWIISTHGMF